MLWARARIGSYSGLTLSSGTHWSDAFKLRLCRDGKANCKVLIAVFSPPAFFNSKQCMEEVGFARKLKIKILPLVFQPRDQWPSLEKWWPMRTTDDESLRALREMAIEVGHFNAMPPLGVFQDNVLGNIDRLIDEMRPFLSSTQSHSITNHAH